MSTFIVHLLIPPLTALAARYFPPKFVWAWVWVSVIPDIDYVGWILYVESDHRIPNFHRGLLHNVFFLGILLFFATRSFVRFRLANPDPTFPRFLETWRGSGWVLSSYYYFTHILLDVFQGGVVPFWPLWNKNIYSYFFILVNTNTQEVSTEAGTETSEGTPDVVQVYPWLDSEQFAYILLIIASLVFAYVVWRKERRIEIVRAVRVDSKGPTFRPFTDTKTPPPDPK